MMRRMRSGLVTAKSGDDSDRRRSAGRMKMRSFTPEKNSAPSSDQHEDHRRAEVVAGQDGRDDERPRPGRPG